MAVFKRSGAVKNCRNRRKTPLRLQTCWRFLDSSSCEHGIFSQSVLWIGPVSKLSFCRAWLDPLDGPVLRNIKVIESTYLYWWWNCSCYFYMQRQGAGLRYVVCLWSYHSHIRRMGETMHTSHFELTSSNNISVIRWNLLPLVAVTWINIATATTTHTSHKVYNVGDFQLVTIQYLHTTSTVEKRKKNKPENLSTYSIWESKNFSSWQN